MSIGLIIGIVLSVICIGLVLLIRRAKRQKSDIMAAGFDENSAQPFVRPPVRRVEEPGATDESSVPEFKELEEPTLEIAAPPAPLPATPDKKGQPDRNPFVRHGQPVIRRRSSKFWWRLTHIGILLVAVSGVILIANDMYKRYMVKPPVAIDPCLVCKATAQQYDGAYVIGGTIGDRTIIKEASCSGGTQCESCIVTVLTYGNAAPVCMTPAK